MERELHDDRPHRPEARPQKRPQKLVESPWSVSNTSNPESAVKTLWSSGPFIYICRLVGHEVWREPRLFTVIGVS